MPLVMKIAVDKPSTPKESRACSELVKALDNLMTVNEVEPVTWVASKDEDEDKLIFEAHVPADCMPEFELIADYLAETYSEFNQNAE